MSGYLRKMARKQVRASGGLTHRTVRDHHDLLQNIEAVLIAVYRECEGVDDQACHAAIESVLTGQALHDPMGFMLADVLAKTRQVRLDVSDEAWQDALRVVARSIRNHSSRQPGQIDYLAFVDGFMP